VLWRTTLFCSQHDLRFDARDTCDDMPAKSETRKRLLPTCGLRPRNLHETFNLRRLLTEPAASLNRPYARNVPTRSVEQPLSKAGIVFGKSTPLHLVSIAV
jgi:hypothetical protein